MKAAKFALVVLAALAALGAAGVTYLALTFDPLDHAPRLIELVKNKTGRTLGLNGRIELSYWPELSVRIRGMSLSERASDAPFAEIESARLNVRILPLLSRQLVVDEIVLSGARVRVTRLADGRLNIYDLISGEADGLAFEIGRVKLENSAVTYRDLVTGKVYEFSGVQLESPGLSPARDAPLSLAFRATDVAGTFDLAAELKGRYTFDAASRRYALDQAILHFTGTALGLTQLAVQAQGNLEGDVKQQTWRLPQLQAKFSVKDSGLPAAGVDGVLEGQAQVELANESVKSRVTGRIGASRIKALITSSGFAAPVYHFDIDVDQLDLDRYIVADLPRTSQADKIDLSTIAELPATGTLKIGMLKTSGVSANNVRLEIKP